MQCTEHKDISGMKVVVIQGHFSYYLKKFTQKLYLTSNFLKLLFILTNSYMIGSFSYLWTEFLPICVQLQFICYRVLAVMLGIHTLLSLT